MPGTTGVSSLGIRHLFQGQLWTQETGLNDYRNRVELPTMGVFLQPDPIGFKGDAANIYRFCNNNGLNRIDPDGLLPISSPDFRWSHLMWEQGNSPHGFDDLYQEYVNRAAGDHGAGGGGRETFRTAREAADSRAPEVTNAAIDQSKLPVEKRREPYSAIGQAEDGSSSYVASQIKYGRTLGDIRELRRKNLGTKALRSDITKEDLPKGYQHLVGYVLGHMAFHADYVTADFNEAKQRGLGVAIIVAPGNKRHPLPYYIPHEKDHPDPVY